MGLIGFGISGIFAGALWIACEIFHNNRDNARARGYVLWGNVILGAIFIIFGFVCFMSSGLSIRNIVYSIFN